LVRDVSITRKLRADGVLVKEVMLRDVQLPPEYAKGLESLLLKEQENDRLSADLEIKQKEVHSAELEAEAEKAAERMKSEAAVLKQNPLLIQKIIAQRLSDKVQIMMVPNDGKFFFANDVLRGAMSMGGAVTGKPAEPEQ
jgi:hypothetical protein